MTAEHDADRARYEQLYNENLAAGMTLGDAHNAAQKVVHPHLHRDYETYQRSVKEIRRAILREFQHNIDIGELLVQAVSSAQQKLDARDNGEWLTQNRPGSWEAALVEPMIQRELFQ